MAKDRGRHVRRILGRPLPPVTSAISESWLRREEKRQSWRQNAEYPLRLQPLLKIKSTEEVPGGLKCYIEGPKQYGPSPIPRSRKSGRPLT
jgi:hypothetical protein